MRYTSERENEQDSAVRHGTGKIRSAGKLSDPVHSVFLAERRRTQSGTASSLRHGSFQQNSLPTFSNRSRARAKTISRHFPSQIIHSPSSAVRLQPAIQPI